MTLLQQGRTNIWSNHELVFKGVKGLCPCVGVWMPHLPSPTAGGHTGQLSCQALAVTLWVPGCPQGLCCGVAWLQRSSAWLCLPQPAIELNTLLSAWHGNEVKDWKILKLARNCISKFCLLNFPFKSCKVMIEGEISVWVALLIELKTPSRENDR